MERRRAAGRGIHELPVGRRGALLWWGIAALAPCILLAASGPFATWSVAGLETGLFTLGVTAALCHVARHRATRAPREIRLAAAALLVANLTRPEGAIVAAVLGALAIAGARREAGARRQVLLALVLIYALPYAAYFAWRTAYFGFLFPNTFYAKTGATVEQVVRGTMYCAFFARDFMVALAPALGLWLVTPEPKPLEQLTGDMGDLEVETVRRDYVPAATWMADALSGEAGYFSYLERRDHLPGHASAASDPL